MLNWLKDNMSTMQGRLGTGVAFLAAVVVGLWPDHAREWDIEKLVAVGGTGIAWLLAELSGASEPSPHDRDLFGRIVERFPDATLEFLRNHDFGASFPRVHLEGVVEVDSWHGARTDFQDAKLQTPWNDIRAKIGQLVEYYVGYTVPMHGNVNLATVHPTNGDPGHPNEHTLAEILQLNNASTALSSALDDFERLARRRLKL